MRTRVRSIHKHTPHRPFTLYRFVYAFYASGIKNIKSKELCRIFKCESIGLECTLMLLMLLLLVCCSVGRYEWLLRAYSCVSVWFFFPYELLIIVVINLSFSGVRFNLITVCIHFVFCRPQSYKYIHIEFFGATILFCIYKWLFAQYNLCSCNFNYTEFSAQWDVEI